MTISIVIPVHNEEASIGPLLLEIQSATSGLPVQEVIVVDDGSHDGTVQSVKVLKDKIGNLRLISHKERSGQSVALRTGIVHAAGPLIVTMDGDGQNHPADIELLF